jgi:hypothetical protein
MRSPLRYVIKDGKHADCWQVGGTNHGCFLRFDLGGTPRITQVKTAVLQASAFMRIGGSGIDGGLLGAPLAGAKLHREYLTKGPGSIKGDGTYVGCASRYDDTDSPSAAVALGHTDSSSYSCKVEALKGAWRATLRRLPASTHPSTPSPPPAPNQPPDAARGLATGGLAAGFFNVSLEVFANHRGVAYHDAQRQASRRPSRPARPGPPPPRSPPDPTFAPSRPSPNPTSNPNPNPNPNPGGHRRRAALRCRARAADHCGLTPPRLARRR